MVGSNSVKAKPGEKFVRRECFGVSVVRVIGEYGGGLALRPMTATEYLDSDVKSGEVINKNYQRIKRQVKEFWSIQRPR